MTCQEFREMYRRHPLQCSVAEVAAHCRHYKDCAACRQWEQDCVPVEPPPTPEEDAAMQEMAEKIVTDSESGGI